MRRRFYGRTTIGLIDLFDCCDRWKESNRTDADGVSFYAPATTTTLLEQLMKYASLGNTGLIVSRLAFGAMTFTAGNKDIGSIYKVGAKLADELVGRSCPISGSLQTAALH